VDYVFHLAAQIDVRKAVEDPGLDAQVNVDGTINVLNVCVASHVRRFVMSSAGGATGDHGVGTGERAQQHFVDRTHQTGRLVH
jgi:UDP-glucose 4-epimerase